MVCIQSYEFSELSFALLGNDFQLKCLSNLNSHEGADLLKLRVMQFCQCPGQQTTQLRGKFNNSKVKYLRESAPLKCDSLPFQSESSFRTI